MHWPCTASHSFRPLAGTGPVSYTHLGDVLPLSKDIGKYHIGETAGFPFSRQTKKIGKMDCVVPTTLESNVVLLHQFLYGEEISYSPSSSVRKISAHISEETGLYEEGKAAPFGGGSSGGLSLIHI